jgi:hypothetical protein
VPRSVISAPFSQAVRKEGLERVFKPVKLEYMARDVLSAGKRQRLRPLLRLLASLAPYCNRTATGLVQASTQRTKVVSTFAENPKKGRITGRTGTDCNGRHRIVALEKVAGSIPVGHPLFCRQVAALYLAAHDVSLECFCVLAYSPDRRVRPRLRGRSGRLRRFVARSRKRTRTPPAVSSRAERR